LVAIGACSSDPHRLGTGDDEIKKGKGGTGGTAGTGGTVSSGGTPGSGGVAGSTSDPCAGQTFPQCAPACPGGFQIAGTKCTPGDECTITNFGDQCQCGDSGTWLCEVHPPLGTGCNKVCEEGGGPTTKWYRTCGDPSCHTPDPDDPAIPNCTTETEGAACSQSGAFCEIPGDSCGQNLICTDTDPTAGPGGCPISRARYKTGIDYLDQKDLEAVRDDFLHMKMARWHYKTDPVGTKPHLGFIIDDQPDSPAVMPNGEHVDLYGYTSMAASTIQLQQKQIDSLQRELKNLRETVNKRCK
jgi:hypothetical protein